MCIVLIFRVAAQISVEVIGVRVGETVKIVVPRAVDWVDAREEVLAEIREVVSRAVALAVAVFKAVAQLQEGTAPQRLAVCSLQGVESCPRAF